MCHQVPNELYLSRTRRDYQEANPDNVSDYMFIIVRWLMSGFKTTQTACGELCHVVQTSSRRSLLTKCDEVSLYTRRYYFIYASRGKYGVP